MRKNAKQIIMPGIIAALYVALTLAVSPLSYGAIQLRFSEVLILLVFLDKRYGIALILACALVNAFSPLGIIDVFFGTLGTACAVFCISRTKSLFVATLWPTLFCVFVGIELHWVYDLPFLYTCLTVMAGEAIVVSGIGYPLFKMLIKNEKLLELLMLDD